MLLYLVRHGETEENRYFLPQTVGAVLNKGLTTIVREHIIQGQLDTKLNATGVKQAQIVAKALRDIPFDAIYCSDLSRAVETANEIASDHPDIRVQLDPALRERHMGDLQGKRRDPGKGYPSNMETTHEFQSRVIAWWENITSAKEHESTVAVVGHGAWIGFLLRYLVEQREYNLADEPKEMPSVQVSDPGRRKVWYISNGSLQVVRAEKDGRGMLLRWGDTRHLSAEEEEYATNADAEIA